MRVTLDDDGYVYFDGIDVGFLADTRMTIADYEKLQEYIAAANEAFDAMQIFVNRVDNKEIRSNRTYSEFKDILEKVGD